MKKKVKSSKTPKKSNSSGIKKTKNLAKKKKPVSKKINHDWGEKFLDNDVFDIIGYS